MIKSIVELLYGSALRVGEACKLRLEDIDFTKGIITVTNYKNNKTKWKCPATEVSLRLIKHYIKTSKEHLLTEEDKKQGYLYPQKPSFPLKAMINRTLKNECKRHNLKTITSHSFRHSCATHLLKAGAGIREVQAMLGHERITSTERYTRVVKEDLKKAVKTFHPREKEYV